MIHWSRYKLTKYSSQQNIGKQRQSLRNSHETPPYWSSDCSLRGVNSTATCLESFDKHTHAHAGIAGCSSVLHPPRACCSCSHELVKKKHAFELVSLLTDRSRAHISPKMKDIQAALINAGYRVSQQHKEPTALKTDAPPNVVWDVMRCWVREKFPALLETPIENDIGYQILSQEPTLQANFKVCWMKAIACISILIDTNCIFSGQMS